MNQGKYVFSQVMEFFPRWVFEKAVKIHLWVAISAYLLLAWVKAALKSPLTITEVSKIIEASILSKADIKELLDVHAPLTQNQNVNELLLNFSTLSGPAHT